MEEHSAELLYDAKATLSEGPSWNAAAKSILWVDIEEGLVNRLDVESLENKVWDVGRKVGFAVDTAKGDIVAGTMDEGLVRLDPATGAVTPFADPEKDLAENRFNDGKCDPRGRIFAGTMSVNETENAGSLYRVGSDLSVEKLFSDVTISNGLAWSPDDRTLYYIDTPKSRVDAFDYDPESGAISNRRPVVQVPTDLGYPDGMTIDDDGMLWIALWAGWAVTRWNPHTGELLAKVKLPVEKVTACCFGGDNYEKLVITTASRDLTDEERKQQPHAGGLFVAEIPGIVGGPGKVFAG